ncbi:MAG: hypothetical protein BJ554DRAFT_5839, partial [Olpidium bornovanus]
MRLHSGFVASSLWPSLPLGVVDLSYVAIIVPQLVVATEEECDPEHDQLVMQSVITQSAGRLSFAWPSFSSESDRGRAKEDEKKMMAGTNCAGTAAKTIVDIDNMIGALKMTPQEYRARKVALITGAPKQGGMVGYTVHGIIRRSSSFNTGRIEHLYKDQHVGSEMVLHYGDLTDSANLVSIISRVLPTEVYNLGAQSHVKVSFDMAEYTVCKGHACFEILMRVVILLNKRDAARYGHKTG